MSTKVKAVQTPGGFCIRCPKCDTKHLFTWAAYATYFLNEDDHDVFHVDDDQRMYPDFVCRREDSKCNFMDAIVLTQ